MSRVHSVSKIKVMLSGILGPHVELKNIKVRGRISPLSNTYFLSDGEIGIGCFIPPAIKAKFAGLLAPGNPVVVQGHVRLHTAPGFNEYQINVDNITPDTDGIVVFSVSEVKNELLSIIENRSELIDIRARGKVNRIGGLPDNVLSLMDSDGSAILCEFHNHELSSQAREEVLIRGKICNFSTNNKIQYRIDVAEIEPCPPDDSIAQCQCDGCESCRPQGGNQSCPSLQDLEYELCANCYRESPDREDRVVQAVYAYLDALGGNGFTPKKEQTIQNFSRPGRTDVVLIRDTDETETFAAIAECKGAGYEGDGRAQLNGYLSVTNTDFGIFANRVDPSQWEFYKKQGQNEYQEIPCDQFKREVKRLTDPDLISARDQVDALKSENKQLKQTQQGLKEEFNKIKLFLESAMQKVNQVREKIDE